MKLINRITLILLLSFSLISCATGPTRETIIKGTRIDLPAPPKPIGINGKEGVTTDKYTVVEPPYVADSYQYWRAYKDGAIIWKPKDWRIIDDYIKSSQSWIGVATDRIKVHNQTFDTENKLNNDKKWYNFGKK